MKQDVLLLCQYFYPEHVSSAVLPTQLAEELVASGLKVGVICGWPHEYYSDESVSKDEVYQGVKIRRLKYTKLNSKTYVGRLVNFLSFFVSTMLHLTEIRKYKVLLVYSNPPILPLIGYWAHKIGQVQFVFVGLDLYPDNAIAINAINPKGLICKLMKYINRKVYLNAAKVVAISEDMRDYMLDKHGGIIDESRIAVIPNWYTGEVSSSSGIINIEFQKLRQDWDLIVVYTGNMGEAQELDTIVDSIIEMAKDKKFEDVLFVFTGHGSRRKEIEQRLKEGHVKNVRFYGFLKGQEYHDVLSMADVCLVSLKRGVEGLGVPSKTYGYFAHGKPIISIMSDRTELAKRITTCRAGFNVEPGDTAAFMAAIEEFLSKPDPLRVFGKNSLGIHNSYYRKETSLNKYKTMVRELLARV